MHPPSRFSEYLFPHLFDYSHLDFSVIRVEPRVKRAWVNDDEEIMVELGCATVKKDQESNEYSTFRQSATISLNDYFGYFSGTEERMGQAARQALTKACNSEFNHIDKEIFMILAVFDGKQYLVTMYGDFIYRCGYYNITAKEEKMCGRHRYKTN